MTEDRRRATGGPGTGLRSSVSGLLSESPHLIYPIANRTSEDFNFLGCGAACSQAIAKLPVGDAPHVSEQPLDVADSYSFFEVPAVLARVSELDQSAFHFLDEVRRLLLVALRVPLLAAHHAAPLPHARAPIRDHVAALDSISITIFNDRRVRASPDIATVFVVPVRGQHNNYLQSIQLARSDKRVLF